MRKHYRDTRDGDRFKKGQQVKCIYKYDKSKYTHPGLGEIYKVLDCYWYDGTEYVDIRSENYKGGGGWYADSFQTFPEPFVYRSKKEPPRFTNHRRIILGDT